MATQNLTEKVIDQLQTVGFEDINIHYQLTPEELYSETLKNNQGELTSNGVLAIKTGKFTGRSPKDRFIVKDSLSKEKVWWGEINQPFTTEKYEILRASMLDYAKGKEYYVRDVKASADEKYEIKIRVLNESPWANLFSDNMFISIDENQLENFQNDWLIINLPSFLATPSIHGTRQENFTVLNLTKKEILIGGSGYTGEIKKGIFSALNFLLPVESNVFPMHCSANYGKDGDTAIFFGLSGTGKTTLSADPNRKLIGDDEHGWTPENTVFNFEGGSYAKVIDLSEEKEPEIFGAIKPGALLENVILKENKEVDFQDTTITQNTRVSYPIEFMGDIQKPSIGDNPKNIFFLTADAFGVLPPISKLTAGEAAYHFISGYTAKVAGTEEGVSEPIPSFSACFGAPFMPLHPVDYAEMLMGKMKKNKVNVWLVNTGWTGGAYGDGSRIKLKYTRAMISAVLDESLDLSDSNFETHSIFGLNFPKVCPNVPSEVLNPSETWMDKEAYRKQAKKLVQFFHENFEKFSPSATKEILDGALPKL